MELKEWGTTIAELVSCSASLNRSDIVLHIILNPAAGRFRKPRFLHSEYRKLREYGKFKANETATRLKKSSDPNGEAVPGCLFSHDLVITEYPGHAGRYTKTIIKRCREENFTKEHLIITAGGDGTAIEVCSALVNAKEEERDRITLFRLPFGTGNDGLDAETLEEAWETLSGETVRGRIGYVTVTPKNHNTLYSFNIASIGLDAYVTDLSNKLKNVIPASFYGLMVNVAALFYEKTVDTLEMNMEVFNGEKSRSISKEYLLLAFGVTGNRSYGGKKRILPTHENICVVKPMGLIKKFAIKNRFYKGEHVLFDEAELLSADRIIIHCSGKMPIQYDGEAFWLTADNFPVVIQKKRPIINVLKRKPSRETRLKGGPR